MNRLRLSAGTLVLAALAASCTHDARRLAGPTRGPSFSSIGSSSQGSLWTDADDYVVEYAGSGAQLAAAVTAASGHLVRIHPEVNVATVDGLTPDGATRLAAAATVRSVTRDVLMQLVPPVEQARFQLAVDPGVADASPATTLDPSQAIRFAQWQWNMRAIHADQAWPTGIQGQGARVAILDTGIDDTHPELTGCVDRALSTAFVPNQNTTGGFPAWGDDNLHGTWVASQICTNAFVIASIAPQAKLIAVKVLSKTGSGTFGGVIAGVLYAANLHVNVINMSLGAYIPRNEGRLGRLNALLAKVDNYAASKGALVVAAVGNDGVNLDSDRDSIDIPAQSGSTMGISATGPIGQTNFDQLAVYSNFGRSAVSVAAPGGGVRPDGSLASILDLVSGACSRQTLDPRFAGCRSGIRYVFAAGTSGATPHAAGVAALVSSRFGNALTSGQLRTRLEQSADDLGKPGVDLFYSHGRINAFRAVTQ